jgi:anti-sigma factor RsiW
MMRCEEAAPLLDAHADGELDQAEDRLVAEHALSCPRCAGSLDRIRRARAAVRALGRFAAPAGLERRVRAAAAAASAAAGSWRVPAAFALGLACGALALFLALGPPAWRQFSPGMADYVSAHVRAQLADKNAGIASGDPHTIRPWLGGRIGLAPRVADLSDEGFPLLGARVDHVGGRDAAALVYGRRKHVINLFVQADDAAPLPQGQRHGYTVLSWRDLDLRFVAVSDLAPAELDDFARLVRARAGMGAFAPAARP